MRVITFSRYSSTRSKFVAISFSLCSKFGSIVLMLGTMTLGEMIASEPYARENEVSPIARLLVVRYAHRTPGSSSGQLPFLSEKDFLRQSRMVLLDMCCLMPYFSKNFNKSLPTNCGPLSVTYECGMPKWQMVFFHMKCSMSV